MYSFQPRSTFPINQSSSGNASADGQTEVFGVTAEHPFWVVDHGWKPAGELELGDEIFTSQGGWLRVSGATWTSSRQTVYNFEVEGFHTYFVGESEAWVHNADCFGLPEGYRPEPGERTINGYVEGVVDDVGKEVTILNEAGREIRRFGPPGKHRIKGPHVHTDFWNPIPGGKVQKGVESGARELVPDDIKKLYKGLSTGNWRTKGGR